MMFPECPDCGMYHDLEDSFGVGVADGGVILVLFGLPVPLRPERARDMAKALREAADLAEWSEELEEDDDV